MKLTNRQQAETNPAFRQACADAGVYPSRQRFRKWKYGRGVAFQHQHRIDKQRANAVEG